MKSFNINDWVTLNKPSHPWHGMYFQVNKIMADEYGKQYELKFGNRLVIVDSLEVEDLFDQPKKYI
jgi:hypothetical protein